jgi:transcriptional regulator with XRE-family HTH domain
MFMGYYPRLRDLREDKDLSIRKLADILHMQRTTYHNYETGKRELPFELAVTLAKFYGVSLDYIGGLTDVPTPPGKKQSRDIPK